MCRQDKIIKAGESNIEFKFVGKVVLLAFYAFIIDSAFGMTNVAAIKPEPPGFKAHGIVRYQARGVWSEEYQEFDFAVYGPAWKASIRTSLDGFLSVSEVVCDGVNQYGIDMPSGTLDTNHIHQGFAQKSFIPYWSPFLQTLWFGLCQRQWSAFDSNRFPNLQTFLSPPARTNCIATFERGAWEDIKSISIFFPYEGKLYLADKLSVDSSTNILGQSIPLSFHRDIYGRFGVERVKGHPELPVKGITYDSCLNRYAVTVSQVRPASEIDVEFPHLPGLRLHVDDYRFGEVSFPVTHDDTNTIRTQEELVLDANPRSRIRQVQSATLAENRMYRKKWNFVGIIVFGSLFAFGLLTARYLINKNRKD